MTSPHNTLSFSGFWLGLLGVFPFIGLTFLALLKSTSESVETGFLLYSAMILSFMGGVIWGRVMQDNGTASYTNLLWAILPALIGWLCVFVGGSFGFLGLLIGFTLNTLHDFHIAAMPLWYRRMRYIVLPCVLFCHVTVTWLYW